MKLKAGDRVLIDLDIVRPHCVARVFQCCGRGYDQDDLHRLLRCLAEGEWRVATWQSGMATCVYCRVLAPRLRGEIVLEAASPVLAGGHESRYWVAQRSWLRREAGDISSIRLIHIPLVAAGPEGTMVLTGSGQSIGQVCSRCDPAAHLKRWSAPLVR